MTTRRERSQAGFSLVELMVAMVITGVVSLSIYALMAQGQNAFQREPALTDRQQNARIAIDLIESDIANAGRGLPLVAQAFSDALDAAGPPGAGGFPSDELEIVIGDPRCPSWFVCTGNDGINPPAPGNVGVAGVYGTREPMSACLNPAPAAPRPLILLASPMHFSVHTNVAGGPGGACPGGGVAGTNGSLTLGAALPVGFGWPAGAPGGVSMYAAQVVHYRLFDTNADGFLSLERNERGTDPAGWQIVARGIDDLQVEYMNGGGAWTFTPGAIPPCAAASCTLAEYNSIVRNVRVTLSARTAEDRVVGSATGGVVRGTATTIATPRAAVTALEWATKALPPGTIIFN